MPPAQSAAKPWPEELKAVGTRKQNILGRGPRAREAKGEKDGTATGVTVEVGPEWTRNSGCHAKNEHV